MPAWTKDEDDRLHDMAARGASATRIAARAQQKDAEGSSTSPFLRMPLAYDFRAAKDNAEAKGSSRPT